MFDPGMVPTPDPNPLPAPYWVFKVLLVVTFFLHILAMNFMLGGAALALVARWRRGSNKYGNRIFLDVAKKVPVLMAATISLGIAPLLFVQVLYGQYFYTSSILLAWPWFLVILFLVAAYYGFYFVSYHGERRPRVAGNVMLFSVTLVLIIGFIYTNNITLGLVPSRWVQKYLSSASGWNLNLSEPTLFPRYLHFMTAAIAVGGILLVLIAWSKWKQDSEYARSIFQFGGKAFMYATMTQFMVGIWFLVSLPRDLRMLFLGDNSLATSLLGFGVTGALISIFVMSDALRKENVRLASIAVTSIMGLVILSMSVMRDILRDAYLKPYFHPQEFAVKTQWSPFLLFLGLFLAGIVLWAVMLKRYGFFAKSRAAGQ
ncbi:MAG: hypothetical protein WAM85_12685 [Terracidiphilus sp.]